MLIKVKVKLNTATFEESHVPVSDGSIVETRLENGRLELVTWDAEGQERNRKYSNVVSYSVE